MRILFSAALALAFVSALGAAVGSASAKPAWATNECTIDDGYNRYRLCNSGD